MLLLIDINFQSWRIFVSNPANNIWIYIIKSKRKMYFLLTFFILNKETTLSFKFHMNLRGLKRVEPCGDGRSSRTPPTSARQEGRKSAGSWNKRTIEKQQTLAKHLRRGRSRVYAGRDSYPSAQCTHIRTARPERDPISNNNAARDE